MATTKTARKTTHKTATAGAAHGAAVVRTGKRGRPRKVVTKKELVYADDQKSFWVSDGQVLNSLLALRDALERMEKEVYGYHVGAAHNDFASWVSEVLGDTDCAADLEKAKSPKSARTVVVKHLKVYEV